MKHLIVWFFGYLAAILLAGCWTVKETEHPQVSVAALPAGKDVRVQLAGFDATVTTYDEAYHYTTMTGWGGPWYGHRGWYRGGGWSTAVGSTVSFVPRTTATSVYRDRATDALECAGFLLKTKDPEYRIEVRFEGPYSESGDGWAAVGWTLCTLFTADYGGATWVAKLRIYESKTGKLLLSRDLSERDEAVVWGPIPLFSPAGSNRTSGGVLKAHCLMALTDRAVAESSSFLSAR